MIGVVQRKLAERRLTAARVCWVCSRVNQIATVRDSRQTSFPADVLDAYSDDTAKAARELSALRQLFI